MPSATNEKTRPGASRDGLVNVFSKVKVHVLNSIASLR
jgi:hypothetical protein